MSPNNKKKLNLIRIKLDKLDNKLLDLIKYRTSLVKEVLKLKEFKKEIVDKKRINFILNKIKEKYKNDPQKMSRAQMELYKSSGANPMGGCLPMLIQMPILVSVFSIFRSKIEFRGAPFFSWINDLSVPDTLFEIGGFPINILPVLMGSTMFIQQQMMAAPNADANQKTMMYVMNVFFLFLFYSFPSGLNLYYFVFNLLSIIQQKYLIPKPAEVAMGVSIKK